MPRRSAAANAVRPPRPAASPQRPSPGTRPRVRSPHHQPSTAEAASSSVVASNLSLGSGVIDHQVFAGSPDARQRPFGPSHQDPYPGGYATPPQGGCGTRCRFPVAFRRPGLRFSRHPVPAEELKLSLRSAYQAYLCLDLNGVTTFRKCETRSGWASPLSRGGGALPADRA